MDNIESIIDTKLSFYELIPYKELDSKLQNRLIETETFIIESENKIKKLIEEIKELKVSKSTIANSKSTSFTRKTIYNEPILRNYIDKSIEDTKDYFNEKKIEKLNLQLNEIKEQYDKVIINTINFNMLKQELRVQQEEIVRLMDENKRKEDLIKDKEKVIQNLKSHIKKDNINTINPISINKKR